jgi:hypothetical protein
MAGFIRLDKGNKDIEPVALRCPRSSVHELIYFSEDRFVIFFVSDGSNPDFH